MLNNHRQNRGFVLVATLFVIALLAMGATYFAGRVDALRSAAFEQQSVAEAEKEAFTARNMLMHAMATNPTGVRGLEVGDAPLALDNRPFRFSAKTLIRVQDERALINLNLVDARILRRFLTIVGVPAGRQGRLMDTLADYIDIDDFKRLNGAEKDDYVRLGLPPPPNNYLLTRDEIGRILGWSDLLAELDAKAAPGAAARLIDNLSATRTAGININAAPRTVLMALPGIDPLKVDSLLRQRKTAAFRNFAELALYSNGALDDEATVLTPGASWRVSQDRADLPFLLECRLTATPLAQDKPVQLDDCRRRARTEIKETVEPDEVGRALNPATSGDLKSSGQPSRLPLISSINDAKQRVNVIEAPSLPWLSDPVADSRR